MTEDGYEIKATEWHDFYTTRGKIKLKDLKPGDELLIQSGKGQFGGCGDEELGTLLGLITGDGHFTNRGKGSRRRSSICGARTATTPTSVVGYINALIARLVGAAQGVSRERGRGSGAQPDHDPLGDPGARARVLRLHGAEPRLQVPEIVWRGNEACVKGYLRGAVPVRMAR